MRVYAERTERMLTPGRYLLGVAFLAIVLVPIGFAAWNLRRRFLSGWSGSPARLAELVLGLALLFAASMSPDAVETVAKRPRDALWIPRSPVRGRPSAP